MANNSLTFGVDLLPNSTTKEYNLGSSTNKWNIFGDLTGNASTASAANLTSTKNGVAYYSDDSGTFAATSAGTDGYILIGKGADSAPEWQQTLPVSHGGTGLTTTTNVNAVVIGNSSSATSALQTVATASGAFYSTGANAKPQFGKLPIAQGGTNATSFTDGCVIVPSTSSNTQSLGSTGLKVSGSTSDNITLQPNTAGKSMTIQSTTGAMSISSTTGAITIGTTTGALTIQTNGASGANLVLKTAGNSGTVTLQSVKSSVSISSGTTMSISSTTSTSIAATTSMTISSGTSNNTTINSGSTLYLNKPTTASIIFTSGGADTNHEKGRFNTNGMFQLNDAGTQNTHRLYVNGDSAFNGKIAFGTQASNAITTKAYMVWNSTDSSIDFIFA